MRNHSTIIREAGPDEVAALTKATIFAVRSWVVRDSIPSAYWQVLVDAELTNANELMLAAAKPEKAA